MANEIEAGIQVLLTGGRFDEARQELQAHLLSGAVTAGLEERPWVGLAIGVARAILHAGGSWPPNEHAEQQTFEFWDRLLRFFVDDLEPKQRCRSHKGTVHFQRGLFQLRTSLDDALVSFRAARQEDVETACDRGASPADADVVACANDAHTVLAFFELLGKDNLNGADRAGLIYYIFGGAFDAEIQGRMIDGNRMAQALVRLSFSDLERTQENYQELVAAANSGLPRAAVSMAGATLESLLLDILVNGKGTTDIQKVGKSGKTTTKPIGEATLGDLFHEAERRSVFATPPIRASLRMIYQLRNRLHPANESRQQYRLTSRIGVLARKLLEGTLCFWHDVLEQRGQPKP